jgi:hypothetical protein
MNESVDNHRRSSWANLTRASRGLIIKCDFFEDEIAEGTAMYMDQDSSRYSVVDGKSNRRYYRLDSIVEMTSELHHNYQTLYNLGPFVHQ